MEEIAQVYARALFEVARERESLDEVREELHTFVDALNDTRELQRFFFSPYFSVTEKKEGLERAVTNASEEVQNFLQALIERHRMPAIFRIRTEYDALVDEAEKRLPVQITSAIELDEQTVSNLGDQIGRQIDREIEVSCAVDPSIIGGVVLRVGNVILDASIRNRLDQLRKQVAQA